MPGLCTMEPTILARMVRKACAAVKKNRIIIPALMECAAVKDAGF
jgi:hypothetical protein